jgi:hypothetical protein
VKIPGEAAKELLERYKLDGIIILGFEDVAGKIFIATDGITDENKQTVKTLSEGLMKMINFIPEN